MEEEEYNKGWEISIGFYPGILFGFRTYNQGPIRTHVFYIPFIDIALDIEI
jgi:hypothetical protein